MAAVRSKAQVPVGSAQWVLDESRLADDFVAQEVEEFAFSAKNEMEWLNEHMAEVFNRSQFDIAETFKTPGKLRGKTPRTARKRDQLEARAPLTEVFSANRNANHSPSRKNAKSKPIAHFNVAEDPDGDHPGDHQRQSRFSLGAGKENTDSGYHDMTEDEMEVDQPSLGTVLQPTQRAQSPPKPRFVLNAAPRPSPIPSRLEAPTLSRSDSQDTFVSAVEDVKRTRATSDDENKISADTKTAEAKKEAAPQAQTQEQVESPAHNPRESSPFTVVPATAELIGHPALPETDNASAARQSIDSGGASSPSDTSSPRQSIIRKKSSLTFASLPAREPLATKKSVGARVSHADPSKATLASRESQFGKHSSAKWATELSSQHRHAPLGNAPNTKDAMDGDLDADTLRLNEVSESTKKHNKSSTQRLQERFAMLSKSSVPRTSKSISANSAASQSIPTQSAQPEPNPQPAYIASAQEENEESWIGPVNSQGALSDSTSLPTEKNQSLLDNSQQSPIKDVKSIRNIEEELPNQDDKASQAQPEQDSTFAKSTLSYPELPSEPGFKPTNSEATWSEGPLSASKARLFSVLKSAKGIFASSASVSAQAKMEALSTSASSSIHQDSAQPPLSLPAQPRGQQETMAAPVMKSGHQASETLQHFETKPGAAQHSVLDINKPLPAFKETEKQNSGMEKLKSGHVDDEIDAQGISEQAGPAKVLANEALEVANAVQDNNDDENHEDNPPRPPPKPQSSVSQMQKNGELRRPNRPGKDNTQKARPAPVSIRLASQRIGHPGPGKNATASSQQEAAPAVPPKQPMLTKKASNSSLHTTSSTQSFKTAATTASSRPKALEAAARKKEQDEREAQRKAEQKREMEKRRAAKAEEERRAVQEQKAAEQRALEEKQQAQKQALEQRKAEALRRAEQHRNQTAAARSRQTEESNATMTNSEHPQATQQTVRSEASTIRPVSKMGPIQELQSQQSLPHVNPAKPPKRQFNPDMHDDYAQKPLPARPEQQQAKRRRTSEDSFAEVVSRPAMAPPVRPSMMRKDINPKSAHGFSSNANSSYAPAPTTMKGTLQNLPQSQNPKTPHMNDLAKFSTARIPFAEAPNPPQAGTMAAQTSQTVQQLSQSQRVYHPTKTPTNAPGSAFASASHKSSPQYPNGDSIDLPEIATDSEDSDDDNEFVPPEWVNSPALRELLTEQQLLDPSGVFGPIAPLVMEDVFKGNKDRLARFRNRTSSANWNGPDRLTEEEKKKDREARERLERDGGWTFNPST